MKKSIKILLVVMALLTMAYVLGPHPEPALLTNSLPEFPEKPQELMNAIAQEEARHLIKPNNQARIVWANDSLKNKTEYAVVYIHGFSASQGEGSPVHTAVAKKFGCNLFLSRLAEHGIDTSEQLVNLTADKLWESAKAALVIGKKLGNRVILMGTSTGGTLALKLAAEFPNDVAGLVLYSPNIAINDPNAWLVNNPWGLQLARLVKGSNYNTPPDPRPIYSSYWNRPYRLEAVVALQELLESSMNEGTFKAIHQPTLSLFYYRDAANQDPVVKVSAIREMMEQLSTPVALKRAVAMPLAGDHVLASPIRSKDVEGVQRETEKFLIEVMGLKPVPAQ